MNRQQLIDEYESSDWKTIDILTSNNPWVKMDAPELKDKLKGGRLDQWYVTQMSALGEVLRICGYISGDDRWADGTIISTSYVVNIEYDEESQSGIAETRNTVYTLGTKLKLEV